MSEISIGKVAKAEGNPFARGPRAPLADDHPLVVAYRESLDSDEPFTVETETPKKVVALLRKIALEHDKGVRISATEDSVTFKGREKFTRAKKAVDA